MIQRDELIQQITLHLLLNFNAKFISEFLNRRIWLHQLNHWFKAADTLLSNLKAVTFN